MYFISFAEENKPEVDRSDFTVFVSRADGPDVVGT